MFGRQVWMLDMLPGRAPLALQQHSCSLGLAREEDLKFSAPYGRVPNGK